jgi:endonuclease/exonuclease/phosphatase family metal-dependent hydrolase
MSSLLNSSSLSTLGQSSSGMNRLWHILCWNVHGINRSKRWPHLRSKIEESSASIVCLQETKKRHFDASFIRKFAPKRFDKFAFVPSDGASGGLLVRWVGNAFVGQVLLEESFGIVISFTSVLSLEKFTLVNVYGPCEGFERENFVAWLFHLDIADDANWILLGDFNFYRFVESRNQPGANLSDIETFNEIISCLGLIELPMKGRSFTWSNMQRDPLLVQLDWFFTSFAWTIKYPNTLVHPLARPTSDHVPCVISIGSSIPKAKVFRFENYWIRLVGFLEKVNSIWEVFCLGDAAKCLSAKFKRLRKGLRQWNSSFSMLQVLINNCNEVILMLDDIEEQRNLHITEWNFRNTVKNKLQNLLLCKQDYWKKRCTARWAKLGDENTSFFHSMATIRYRKNSISSLKRDDDSIATEHHEKAGILWNSFRDRLGVSVPISETFDFSQYFSPKDLSILPAPFSHEEIDKVVAQMPSDKSPGPDGFSGLFLKVCWPVIKYDFYRLCEEFWEGSLNLQSINDSLITLIPKVASREGANDFRPISLLNICLKLITKILANRLQLKVLELVHVNQYGFLKTRNIQDCVGWAYEYLHQCKHSRREIVILKLDFAKAFDTVEHQAIMKILSCQGYDDIDGCAGWL